jgi:hypothetical protein
VTAGIVTQFQSELAFQGLSIGDPGLRLHARAPWPRLAPADLGIPGAQITFDWERDLRPPPKAGVEARSEALEQGQLSAISDGVPGRIRTQREVESDRREPRTKLREAQALDLSSLEPPDLRIRRPRGIGAGPKAQAGGGPSLAVFATEPSERVARPSSASIGWSFAGGHRRAAWSAPLHRELTACYATRTNGRSGRENQTSTAPQPPIDTRGVTHDRL